LVVARSPSVAALEAELLDLARSGRSARDVQPRVAAIRTLLRRAERERDAADRAERRTERAKPPALGNTVDRWGGYESEEVQLSWAVLDHAEAVERLATARRIPRGEVFEGQGPSTGRARQAVRDVLKAASPTRGGNAGN
jgi:hypothetical protein